MKKLMTASLLALMAGSASAEDVTLQLKWVTQAQFAGYYVAQAKGFYEEEGLNVTIKPGGPDIAPTQVIAGGGADVMVDWMPAALAAREKGLALVNIAQPFASSGMMLTCLAETGITSPADFPDKTLGVWFFGNEYPFLSWMSQLGLATDGSAGGVTVLKQGFNVDPLLQKQAACISTMTYNEYWQVIDAGITPEQLVTFKYRRSGRGDAGGRALCAGRPAGRSGVRGDDGEIRPRLHEGLEIRRGEPGRGGDDRSGK